MNAPPLLLKLYLVISQIGGAFGMSKEAQATFDQVSGMVSGWGIGRKGWCQVMFRV